MKKQLLTFLFAGLGLEYGLGQSSPPAVQSSYTYQLITSYGISNSNQAIGWASNGNVFFSGNASGVGLTSSVAQATLLKFDPTRLLRTYQAYDCSSLSRFGCSEIFIKEVVPTADGGAPA